jgi:phosphoribosylglycinamide formyltransferase 1
MLRAVVLISGSGRTLANFIELERLGRLPVQIVRVISSRPDVRGLDIAREAGIPTEVVCRKGCTEEEFQQRMTAAIDAGRPELICLAGFLSRWIIPDRYAWKVLNIHPALLPKYKGKGYYGHHVHEAVLAAGDAETGCSVHFANNEYDAGPIILQRRVPVLPGDTADALADRVFEQELVAYPEAIRLFASGRLGIKDGRVEIVP